MSPHTSHTPLIVGMVGVGGFGGYRRTRMRQTGLFRLAACYDRNAEALAQACSEEHAKAAQSVEALLAEPGLEGLVISTGIDTHASLAVAAMQAGLHVFVEKPLCGSPAEIDLLTQARQATGRIVGVGHNDVHVDPICRLIRQHLDDGLLGTLTCYEENTSHGGGLEIRPGDWRGQLDRNPGGMLMQCGVHALHQLRHLFGPISSLAAMMRYDANPNTQTADVANVLIRHQSGLIGTLNCYHVTPYCHELRVFGTEATLYTDTHLKKAWRQQRKAHQVEERIEIPVPAVDPQPENSNLLNWYRAIRERIAPRPSLEDGIEAVLPVFAAAISDAQRRTVDLSEIQIKRPQPAETRCPAEKN